MSKKPKPLIECTRWEQVDRTFDHSNAERVRQTGSHVIRRGPRGSVVYPAQGEACKATLRSVIRLAAAAGIVFSLLALALIGV